MKTKSIFLGMLIAGGFLVAKPVAADEPIIPPSIDKVWPSGIERGTTAAFTVDGRNLANVKDVIFDAPGIAARVVQVTDIPEKIAGPRPGVDLGAQVPLGKKQSVQMQVTVAGNVPSGLHWFRIRTPLGTSNRGVLEVGSLPEIEQKAGGAGEAQAVQLPATLVGVLSAPGDTHVYQFSGKRGEELVFQVVAAPLGSQLKSMLMLRDASGRLLAQAGEYDRHPDAVLTAKLPADGAYTLAITDREKGGGPDHFYRLNAGALPYVTGVFPLGVRAGQPAEVTVSGVNLGGLRQIKVDPPRSADGWTTLPVSVKTPAGTALDPVTLAVGNEPEILEREPNDTPAEAQPVSIPVTINGHIGRDRKAGAKPDEDDFRFTARQGQHLTIEVAAARLGSPLDSVIEVLDAQGRPIPRATIRCLNETTTTLADRDSRTLGIRLNTTSGLREGDYLMVGDELDRVAFVPDQPDADTILQGVDGLRLAFLGTSPDVHPVNTPVYKADILPPGAEFPPNGLPVFHLTWRNDDGGPGYGTDSRLDFVAPRDGDYILRLQDVRGLEGPDFAYRLAIRDAAPDYRLSASPDNPNIPKGGTLPVTVTANRVPGYEGPIEIEVKGLPKGVTASPATIPAGQNSTVVVLAASAEAAVDAPPSPIRFVGHARINGRDVTRVANGAAALQLASIIPPPDVIVTAEPREIALQPGQEVKVTLHVERRNGFKGRVPCFVENLPPGVRVVNVGLNGVLVTETQTSRTFTLKAEDWAKPIRQPIYVVAEVESNSPTRHASSPLALRVEGQREMASAARVARQDPSASAPHR